MKCVMFRGILILLFFCSFQVYSAPQAISPLDITSLSISRDTNAPIGKFLKYYLEPVSPLALTAVKDIYRTGEFISSDENSLSFGIGSKPVWLRFEAQNDKKLPISRRLSIETSWLDSIDVYFISADSLLTQSTEIFHSGDSQIFSDRLIKGRFFQFDHAFVPGKTVVYIRVQTPDPLVLPIYLNSIDTTYTRQLFDSYSYGFLYGGLLVLMAYNLMLYFSLKNLKYFLYSLYLASFLLANFSYTGHGYKYLWPDSPAWQLWSNPVVMVFYSVAGLMFAIRFLNMRNYFPKINRLVINVCLAVIALLLFAIISNNHVLALLIAFSFILIFAISMPMLGAISLLSGNKSAKYFLIASVIHTVSAGITAMVVWSLVPYSIVGYRAVDMGMMVDAILLAMALAYQFRTVRDEKLQAEKLAQIDPLTQLNNRRAFHHFVTSMWSNSVRYHHNVSLVIIDIDYFKSINDNYGHIQGDEVLVEVAKTLKSVIRSGDILARWGGEEFIVFLPDTLQSEAEVLAQRFRKNIENIRIKVAAETITLTVSIGVADNKFNSESLDKMISEADKNLYRAKEQGRNRVVSSVLA